MLELLKDTRLDLARSGARFGEGCFETVRMTAGRPWRLDLHLRRLAAGCAFLGLEAPPPPEAVAAFLEAEGIGTALPQAALRLLAVDGGLRAWAEAAPPPTTGPVALGLSRQVLRFSANPLNAFKTLNYLENRRLHREAEARGCFELIAPNERGELTDGGRCTLLARLGGAWVTPPVAAGALPGVGRAVLREAGLIAEQTLVPGDLARAEGLLLVNALRGLLPVGRWEDRALPGADSDSLADLVTALARN